MSLWRYGSTPDAVRGVGARGWLGDFLGISQSKPTNKSNQYSRECFQAIAHESKHQPLYKHGLARVVEDILNPQVCATTEVAVCWEPRSFVFPAGGRQPTASGVQGRKAFLEREEKWKVSRGERWCSCCDTEPSGSRLAPCSSPYGGAAFRGGERRTAGTIGNDVEPVYGPPAHSLWTFVGSLVRAFRGQLDVVQAAVRREVIGIASFRKVRGPCAAPTLLGVSRTVPSKETGRPYSRDISAPVGTEPPCNVVIMSRNPHKEFDAICAGAKEDVFGGLETPTDTAVLRVGMLKPVMVLLEVSVSGPGGKEVVEFFPT